MPDRGKNKWKLLSLVLAASLIVVIVATFYLWSRYRLLAEFNSNETLPGQEVSEYDCLKQENLENGLLGAQLFGEEDSFAGLWVTAGNDTRGAEIYLNSNNTFLIRELFAGDKGFSVENNREGDWYIYSDGTNKYLVLNFYKEISFLPDSDEALQHYIDQGQEFLSSKQMRLKINKWSEVDRWAGDELIFKWYGVVMLKVEVPD